MTLVDSSTLIRRLSLSTPRWSLLHPSFSSANKYFFRFTQNKIQKIPIYLHMTWLMGFGLLGLLPPPRDKLIWPGTRQERRHKENLRSTADRESPKRRSPFLDPLATRPDSSLTDRSRPFTYVSYGGQESTRYMGCQRSNEYLILQYDVPYILLQPFMSWQGQVWHLTIDAMLTIVGSREIRSLTW